MLDLVEKLSDLLKEKKIKIVTAESCTGGLLATTITHKAGAADIFERGFVSYSNESKFELLDVPKVILDTMGAVSAETAQAMAKGALRNSRAGLAVSITGIAGPEGGTKSKPVGLVYLGYALKGGSSGTTEHHFKGSRSEIQTQATITALKSLIEVMKGG